MKYDEIIDISSAKERFMNNYGLFSKFLFRFPEQTTYSEMETAIEAGDAKGGFEAAHTMKGVVGNLSLKLIESKLFPIVETLRGGNLPDADALGELSETYKVTIDAITELKKEGVPLF